MLYSKIEKNSASVVLKLNYNASNMAHLVLCAILSVSLLLMLLPTVTYELLQKEVPK